MRYQNQTPHDDGFRNMQLKVDAFVAHCWGNEGASYARHYKLHGRRPVAFFDVKPHTAVTPRRRPSRKKGDGLTICKAGPRSIAPRAFEEGYFLKQNCQKKSREWHLFYEEQISRLVKCLDRSGKEVTVCDVGCGLGEFLGLCDDMGWSTFGTDVSEYAVSEARKRTRARLSVSDVQEGIPFDEQFDIITCFDVVEHLERPQAALETIENKLKDGGVLLLTTPNVRARFLNRLLRVPRDETHISEKRKQQWYRILRALNFDVPLSWTVYPVASHKGSVKTSLARLLSVLGLGSTACFLGVKKQRLREG